MSQPELMSEPVAWLSDQVQRRPLTRSAYSCRYRNPLASRHRLQIRNCKLCLCSMLWYHSSRQHYLGSKYRRELCRWSSLLDYDKRRQYLQRYDPDVGAHATVPARDRFRGPCSSNYNYWLAIAHSFLLVIRRSLNRTNRRRLSGVLLPLVGL